MAKEKLTFETKFFQEDGFIRKGIFVDGELFDWGIDEESYKDAMAMGPQYHRIFEQEIAKHFIDSLSEFMNRKVTQQEIDQAFKTGFIDK
jgi:O-acetylhomoserine/O-acetylserine sulfhydrylase-like pyridoxal-dependent enzyme